MRNLLRFSLVFVCFSLTLLLFACGGGGGSGSGSGGSDTPATKSVSVTLKDSDGAAIVGATLSLVDAEGAVKYSATTTDTGVASFTVQDGEEKTLLAKVTAIPEGMTASGEQLLLTHSVESLSAEIVLSIPTYIFKATFNGEPASGITVSLYKNGNMSSKPTVAVTDESGNAVFTVTPGIYKVISTPAPTDPFTVSDALVKAADKGSTVELVLTAAQGFTEDNPISFTQIKHEFVAPVRPGGQYWCKLAYESGAYLTVSSANAVVTYGGNEYKAKSGENFVKVELSDPSGEQGEAFVSIKTANGKAEELFAQLDYPLGSVNNPIEITETVTGIELAAGEKIYYTYKATDAPQKLAVSATSVAGTVTVKNADSGEVVKKELSVLKGKSVKIELSADTATTATLDLSARNYRISILGDSISTYKDYSNNSKYNATLSGNSSVYYPTDPDITDEFTVEDTYWKKIMNAFSFDLCVNNSQGGDRVTQNGAKRAANLHNTTTKETPDVIIVYMGTNDLGHMEDAAITMDDFRKAYDAMLDVIKTNYPDAQVFCATLLPEQRSTDIPAILVNFNSEIYYSAVEHGYTTISFGETGWNYLADTYVDADMRVHPTKKGMQKIADAAIPQIEEKLK